MKKLDIDKIEERKEIDETSHLFYDINLDKIKRNKKDCFSLMLW